jgi:hypothetical protein
MPREVFEILYKTKGTDKTIRDTDKVDKKLGGIAQTAKRLAGPAALGAVAVGLFKVAQSAVKTAAEFETLKTRLVAIRGSVKEGTKLFKELNKIAATTPFALKAVVEAGATLEAFGADASKTTKSIADLAAFMGIGIVEASAAFGRAFAAGAGAADVLRERGVLSLIQMKTGIDDLTKLSLPEFRKAMLDSIEDPAGKIAGSTALLAKTFDGQLSNMGDSVSRLTAALGDRLLPMMKNVVSGIGNWADKLREFIAIDDVKKLQEERVEFTALMKVLQKTNIHQDTRNKTIATLQDKYGEYLSNLDLEKATFEDLENAIKEANKAFSIKIKLAAAEDVLLKKRLEFADITTELIEKEIELASAEALLEKTRKDNWITAVDMLNKSAELSTEISGLREEVDKAEQSFLEFEARMLSSGVAITSTKDGVQTLAEAVSVDLPEPDIIRAKLGTPMEELGEIAEVVVPKVDEVSNASVSLGEVIGASVINSKSALNELGNTFMQVAQIGGKQNRVLFNIGKAAAIASGLINSYQAYTKALASLPYPANLVAAGITLASGLANVALISSQKLPGKQFGGVVEGTMLGDTQPTMLEPGEFVLNRHAVSSIGVETARRINETGRIGDAGAQTVNNNFLVSFDEFFDRMENHRTRKFRYEEA